MRSIPQQHGTQLDAVIRLASEDPQMAAGCLFVKIRATRSRFGPRTQALLTAMEDELPQGYVRFFTDAAPCDAWRGSIDAELAAIFLQQQFALSVNLRVAGKSPASVREFMTLAVSVLR